MKQRKLTKLERKLINWLNNLTLRRKLMVLYVFCIFFPLVLTDGFVLNRIVINEQKTHEQNMQNVATNVAADFTNAIRGAYDISNNIFVNQSIYTFLDTRFKSDSDFFEKSSDFLNKSGFSSTFLLPNISKITLYSANPTIVDGGNIHTFDSIQDKYWFKQFIKSGKQSDLIFFYNNDENPTPVFNEKKGIKYVRQLNYYKGSPTKKMLVIDIDYTSVSQIFTNKSYGMQAYICDNNKLLFNTKGADNVYSSYSYVDEKTIREAGYKSDYVFLGNTYTILVYPPKGNLILDAMRSNAFVIIVLLMMNIFLPLVLMRLIISSFSDRLAALNKVFERNDDSVDLVPVKNVEGIDEIAHLMNGYNMMVSRNRKLVKKIYQDKLVQQETEIEKQQAELLAMRMQINPHFLFNCLDSIRMHSLIKGESETAGIIERLAALEREVVEWKEDQIPLSREMNFIKNYLKLQQYRYGDRFSFRMNIEEDAKDCLIPKLTLATFVENACVHGAEKKTNDVVIMIGASIYEDMLILEVEDTGAGMNSTLSERMQRKMRNATFEDLKRNNHIGILNACIRTKMIAGDKVNFTFESEENIGTYIKIEMPVVHSNA